LFVAVAELIAPPGVPGELTVRVVSGVVDMVGVDGRILDGVARGDGAGDEAPSSIPSPNPVGVDGVFTGEA
jgi:hypothetical protein